MFKKTFSGFIAVVLGGTLTWFCFGQSGLEIKSPLVPKHYDSKGGYCLGPVSDPLTLPRFPEYFFMPKDDEKGTLMIKYCKPSKKSTILMIDLDFYPTAIGAQIGEKMFDGPGCALMKLNLESGVLTTLADGQNYPNMIGNRGFAISASPTENDRVYTFFPGFVNDDVVYADTEMYFLKDLGNDGTIDGSGQFSGADVRIHQR